MKSVEFVKSRPTVLVTNDDGIRAEGLNLLADALSTDYDVWVVAPDREQSAQSHALTLHRPLRITKEGTQRFSVDGRPSDAVYVAVHHLIPGEVDLVLSGINHGANLGDDVVYSGTVSAAAEAAHMGLRAIAFSQNGTSPFDFRAALIFAVDLVHKVFSHPTEGHRLLSVNIPPRAPEEIRGVLTTRLCRRRYDYAVDERVDPAGKPYVWIGGPELDLDPLPGSDALAVREGYISVTPLMLDWTDYAGLGRMAWLEAAGPLEPGDASSGGEGRSG